jgi:hypothetical protein
MGYSTERSSTSILIEFVEDWLTNGDGGSIGVIGGEARGLCV